MQNQKIITEIVKAVLTWRKKGNELVKRLNIPWEVKMPDDRFGVATVNYSDTKITIDLSQLNTETFVVCDEDGNQKTITVIGFNPDEI